MTDLSAVPPPDHLLVVSSWATRDGGAEQMLWALAREIDPRERRLTVVFLEDGPFRAEIAQLGHATAVVRAGRLRDVRRFGRTVRDLHGLLERLRPDVVVAWSAKAHLYVSPAAAAAGLAGRLVWWQHMIPDGGWLDRVATRLPARAVGCSSEAGRRAQRRLGPLPAFVVHPGVSAHVMAVGERPGARTAARTRFGMPDTAFVVAVVGRLDRWKRQDAVLRAIASLRGEGLDARGLFVGGNAFELDGSYARELADLARKLGVADHIVFTGQVEEVAELVAGADVLVNASLDEPFGIVIAEAMILGVPVVAVDSGGPAEIIDHGHSGVLTPDGSVEALTGAVRTLAQNRVLGRRIAERARRDARARFSPAAFTGRLTETLGRPPGHVTVVIHDLGPVGGMERHGLEVVTGLLDRGWSVTVVAFSCDLPSRPGLRFVRIPGPHRPFVLAYPWFAAASAIAVRLHGRGMVHTHGAILGRRSDVSTVHFCHQAFRHQGLGRGARGGPLGRSHAVLAEAMKVAGERWAYRPGAVRALVAISGGVEREVDRWLRTSDTIVARIPHGVDHDVYRPDPAGRRTTRDAVGVGEDDLVLLFVGGEWDRKGLGAAIEAVGLRDGWTLLVAGSGDASAYGRLAASHGADVRFLGVRSDAPSLMNAADAFVLASTYETFSLAAHEAAACGLPLLCSRVHGVDELVQSGVNGAIVERTGMSIAAALASLEDPAARRRMGNAAREASRRYSWTATVDRHELLYASLDAPRSDRLP